MDIKPIGVIRTPFTDIEEMPIQPQGGAGIEGTLELAPEWQEGLADIEGFSHLYLIYSFHAATRVSLSVIPFMDSEPRGVFATRSPLRPNHLGLSVVRLVRRDGCRLHILDVDMLDNTPLIDLKPYIPAFDQIMADATSGWLTSDRETVARQRSDGRFR